MKTKLITDHPQYWLLIEEAMSNKIPISNLVYGLINGSMDFFINWGRSENSGDVHAILGHLPKNLDISLLAGVPLLPKLPEEKMIPMVLARDSAVMNNYDIGNDTYKHGFVQGYKAASSKGVYSEEDMKKAGHDFFTRCMQARDEGKPFSTIEWWNNYFQSLSISKEPKDFQPTWEYEGATGKVEDMILDHYDKDIIDFYDGRLRLKTIPNESGTSVIQGTWVY